MTGFKSKLAMNQVYGPMAKPPRPTWQAHLRSWEQSAITRYIIDRSSGDANKNIISDCMDQMQVLFPGDYTLVWHSPAPNEHHLTVHFEDPKKETMWRLKNA